MVKTCPACDDGIHSGRSPLRALMLLTSGLVSMAGAIAAQAQTEIADGQDDPATGASAIVVTGSRVVRDGYSAPTPVSVIGKEEMQRSATANLADYVNTLPSLSGSSTPQTTANSVFNNGQAINGLSLRGLGVVRTLVLLNGQRVVPALNTGVVDVSEFPQQLVTRVDVVTGGASAAYGSDALSGVVNFVLDTKFTGFKGELSGGITTYGDAANWKIDMTAGRSFADGRGHFILSGEVSDETGKLVNDRDWNLNPGWGWVTNPDYTASNGQPQQLLLRNVGLSSATLGGLITCSATSACASLRGIAFGEGGTPYNIQYGSVISAPFMSGGSWQGPAYMRTRAESLQPSQTRKNIFARVSYEVADDWEAYGQLSYSHLEGRSQLVPIFFPGNLTIRADNAFIPASVAQQVATLGIASFPFGTMNGDLPSTTYFARRQQERYVAGIDGKVDVLGQSWKVGLWGQLGRSKAHTENRDTINTPKYLLAIDAVRAADGNIVCRSTLTDPGNGCVPYNVFGTGVNSAAAINYVQGTPFQTSTFSEKVVSLDISGEPFSIWAGPVSLAMGAVYRQEKSRGVSDPFENPPVPWFFSTGLPTIGQYSVKEAYAETVIPLAKGLSWAKNLDINGAVRATEYRTGTVATWKLGATYEPFDGLRLRAVRSRDIRSPTLDDLFRGTFITTANVNDPFNGNVATPIRSMSSGNRNLTPEIAKTLSLGMVVQPLQLRGFQASLDYYDIRIRNAIGSVTAQQVLNLCYNGNDDFCALVSREASQIVIAQGPFNVGKEHARGLDLEASYQFDLDTIVAQWPGRINIRAMGTRFMKHLVDTGIPGSIPVDNVGANSSSGPPKFRYQVTLGYTGERLGASVTARGVSDGVYNNNYIECTSGCPTSTVNNVTVNNNHIDGANYFDLSLTYKIDGGSAKAELFFNVRNVLNTDPVAYARQTTTGYLYQNANAFLYDILGRVFRAGVRVQL